MENIKEKVVIELTWLQYLDLLKLVKEDKAMYTKLYMERTVKRDRLGRTPYVRTRLTIIQCMAPRALVSIYGAVLEDRA